MNIEAYTYMSIISKYLYSYETKAIWAGIKTLLQDGALLRNYDKAFDDIATDATLR